MEKPARPAGVDDEARRDPESAAVAGALEHDAGVFLADAVHLRLVQVHRAVRLGVADERVIEVRPVPMRVADLVVRARGDEQLARMVAIVGEAFAGVDGTGR